jgi:desulfoferrodoxin-like iron-binding protein
MIGCKDDVNRFREFINLLYVSVLIENKKTRMGAVMHVKNEGEKYACKVCGNEVTVTKAGGGELVCCNEPMEQSKN